MTAPASVAEVAGDGRAGGGVPRVGAEGVLEVVAEAVSVGVEADADLGDGECHRGLGCDLVGVEELVDRAGFEQDETGGATGVAQVERNAAAQALGAAVVDDRE